MGHLEAMDRDAGRGRKGLRLAKNELACSSSPPPSIAKRPPSLRVTEILRKDQQSQGKECSKELCIHEIVQGDSRGSLPTRRNEMRASDASYDQETSGSGVRLRRHSVVSVGSSNGGSSDLARRHSVVSVGSSNGSRQSAPLRTNHDRTMCRGSPVSSKRYTDPHSCDDDRPRHARMSLRSSSVADRKHKSHPNLWDTVRSDTALESVTHQPEFRVRQVHVGWQLTAVFAPQTKPVLFVTARSGYPRARVRTNHADARR
jgi:hypothetical protein